MLRMQQSMVGMRTGSIASGEAEGVSSWQQKNKPLLLDFGKGNVVKTTQWMWESDCTVVRVQLGGSVLHFKSARICLGASLVGFQVAVHGDLYLKREPRPVFSVETGWFGKPCCAGCVAPIAPTACRMPVCGVTRVCTHICTQCYTVAFLP